MKVAVLNQNNQQTVQKVTFECHCIEKCILFYLLGKQGGIFNIDICFLYQRLVFISFFYH